MNKRHCARPSCKRRLRIPWVIERAGFRAAYCSQRCVLEHEREAERKADRRQLRLW